MFPDVISLSCFKEQRGFGSQAKISDDPKTLQWKEETKMNYVFPKAGKHALN